MKILVVEDEAAASRRLVKLIREVDPLADVLGVCESVTATLRWFDQNEAPDLLLLDIQLGDGLSFDIFAKREIRIPVIFTTAYDEYALRAFKVNSVDYLLKPVEREALQQALSKFRALFAQRAAPVLPEELIRQLLQGKSAYKSRFLVQKGPVMVPVSVEQVAYFYTEDRVVFMLTRENQRYLLEHTLDELETLLDPQQFIRANRQFILSLHAVHQLEPGFNGKLHVNVQPAFQEAVIVSRDKAVTFKEWLGNR